MVLTNERKCEREICNKTSSIGIKETNKIT